MHHYYGGNKNARSDYEPVSSYIWPTKTVLKNFTKFTSAPETIFNTISSFEPATLLKKILF